jgi:hypothetical protein
LFVPPQRSEEHLSRSPNDLIAPRASDGYRVRIYKRSPFLSSCDCSGSGLSECSAPLSRSEPRGGDTLRSDKRKHFTLSVRKELDLPEKDSSANDSSVGFVSLQRIQYEQRPTSGFHSRLSNAFRLSQPLDALLHSYLFGLFSCRIHSWVFLLSEVSPSQ